MRRRIVRGFLAAALVVSIAGAAAAQIGRPFGRRSPEKSPRTTTFGRGFNFCRGVYTSDRREQGGSGWATDFPDADLNFSIRLGELTRTRVKLDSQGMPDYVTVRLTNDMLFQCPYLHMEDVGTMELTEFEVRALRTYLLKGGFLWVDDFWGSAAWEQWTREIARVLPAAEYPIIDLPINHAIFRSQFNVTELPQIPSIQAWRGIVGTSERGEDSAEAHARAILDRHGNVIVMMTHNTDISDAWEREGEDASYFYSFSPKGYAVGINVILYAFTH